MKLDGWSLAGAIVGLAGIIIITVFGGAPIAIGVFLMLIGNNLERHTDTKLLADVAKRSSKINDRIERELLNKRKEG